MYMNRILSILLTILLLCPMAGAEGKLEPISGDELPPGHLTALEAEKQRALSSASLLIDRAAPSGYSDSRSDGPLVVDFSISASRVYVGQKVKLEVDFRCEETPMFITYSGLIMDESFRKTGEIGAENYRTYFPSSENSWSHTPDAPGYFCFVMVVSDKAGNRVSFHTNTIQVLKPAAKLEFSSKAVDSVLTAFVSMDKKELQPGETITASCSFLYDMDPIRYTGRWMLYDDLDQGAVLSEFADIVLTGGDAVMTYSCTPDAPGEIVFELEAFDGEDHRVLLITPGIPVKATALPGDANSNGKVDIMDALLTLQHAVGWTVTISLGNADVDDNGTANILDALLILQHSVGWDVMLK